MQGKFIRVITSNERLAKDKELTSCARLIKLQAGIKQRFKPGKTFDCLCQSSATDSPPPFIIQFQHPAKPGLPRRCEELDGELLISITKDNRLSTAAHEVERTLGGFIQVRFYPSGQ